MAKFRNHHTGRVFGPIIIHLPDEGTFEAACVYGGRYCLFLARTTIAGNNTCSHVKPARQVPDPKTTPDWCEMRARMLREVTEIAKKETARQTEERSR